MICIMWDGFPQYGARCVRELVRSISENVVVVAMRPDVPVLGMEKYAECQVVWVERDDPRSIVEVCGDMPRFISVPGWFSPLYNRWRDEVRAAGGHACCGCDNNFKIAPRIFGRNLSIERMVTCAKEWVRALRFRIWCRDKYDFFFVPGKSGRKLFRFYGVPDEKIFEGSYSADATLFSSVKDMALRPKKMLYVGRLNERKNVRRLVQAFARAVLCVPDGAEWQLELCGCGPLREELLMMVKKLSMGNVITISDFVQPEEVALKYREARLFCLPSLDEHWGLVVHEAALSGCVMLLSEGIGASEDLLGDMQSVDKISKIGRAENGFVFDPLDVGSMASAMKAAMLMTEAEAAEASIKSLELSQTVSLDRFAAAILSMAGKCEKNAREKEL